MSINSSARGSAMVGFHAWVFYLDVYGFSARVEGGIPGAVQRQLISAHKDARKLLKAKLPKAIYLSISDSTCLVYPVDAGDDKIGVLDRCADAVSEIMNFFFWRDLPVRGSAAYGEVVCGNNILVGRPVLKAVNLEEALPFPLIAIPLRELYPPGTKRDEIEGWGRHTLETIIVRPEGKMFAYLVFPTDLDKFGDYVATKVEQYLTSGPPAAASGWDLANAYLKNYRKRLMQRT